MSNYHKDLASAVSENLLKIRKQNLRKSFQIISQQKHRLERVAIINKVVYINDASSINANATYFAMKSLRKPIVWIAGGDDKNTNYHELLPLIRVKVQTIIMIGKNNDKLLSVFENEVNEILEAGTMEEAVRLARSLSYGGTRVLLSPAALPDEKFSTIVERGELFIKAVNELK